jgi:hypothetical protein
MKTDNPPASQRFSPRMMKNDREYIHEGLAPRTPPVASEDENKQGRNIEGMSDDDFFQGR